MTEETRCEVCNRTFKDAEGLAQHNSAKHGNAEPKKVKRHSKISKGWMIFLAIVIGVVALSWWGISNIKTLPPTDMSGHVESSPSSHVLREPMLIQVQKHMLEHADGTGHPGKIINYNCEDYNCEDGLIEKLEAFADKYPVNVYVAPFKNMDSKIALTKSGKIELLEEYDEERIDRFVR